MPSRDLLYFQKLKKHLVNNLKECHSEINVDISKWKGREIKLFQDDLEQKVNSRISEKWFYTHLKSDSEKLPRIDILDLLSRYAGHHDWQDYKIKNQIANEGKNWRKWVLVVLPVLLLLSYVLIYNFKNRGYAVSVIDAYSNKVINKEKLKVTQFFNAESPMKIEPNEDGFYVLRPQRGKVYFVVEAPYYHTDTIARKLNQQIDLEIVRLFPNDYAMMLKYFSNSDSEDWTQRRVQLSDIIRDDARILQLDEEGTLALELYTKHSFINKLTIPSKGLRNIEILDIRFEDDKISQLRFTQKKGGKNE